MTQKELLALKEEINKSKTTISEMKGKLSYLMQTLKDTYGCKTVEEAETKVKVLEKKILALTNQIETGTTELEEKYELSQ
jgi:peptidoglycan hydrolase CwlO-like protein